MTQICECIWLFQKEKRIQKRIALTLPLKLQIEAGHLLVLEENAEMGCPANESGSDEHPTQRHQTPCRC